MSNTSVTPPRSSGNPPHVRIERFPNACAVLAEFEAFEPAGRRLMAAGTLLQQIAAAGLAYVRRNDEVSR